MSSCECCNNTVLGTNKLNKLVLLLKLISDDNRLKILCTLRDGKHCVCEIFEKLKISQSLVSHHLKDLKDYELIDFSKEGKKSIYFLTPKGKQIINLVLKIKI